MSILFANNAISTLSGAINTTATTCLLASGTGALFPSPTGSDYFLLTFTDAATGLLNEIVKVTNRTVDTLTIVRAQEGTAAQSWNAGDNADALITAGALQLFLQNGGIASADTGSANALVITPTVPISSYLSGQSFLVIPAHTNTGASTINVSGLGAQAIVHADNTALEPGDVPANGLIQVTYQSTLGKFVLTSFTPGASLTGASGYFRIPGTPFIVQYTSFVTSGAFSGVGVPSGLFWTLNNSAAAWPIAFPTACVYCQGIGVTVLNEYLGGMSTVPSATNVGPAYVLHTQNVTQQTILVIGIGY